MLKAYILIETEKGKTKEVVEALRGLDGALSVESVAGPYDAIALIEGKTLSELGDVVTVNFGRVRGICRTVICASTGSY